MNAYERERDDSADTIIARMEIQFQEGRSTASDTQKEAEELWGIPWRLHAHTSLAEQYESVGQPIEAVGLAGFTPWLEIALVRDPAAARRTAERWQHFRAEKALNRESDPSQTSPARRFIATWVARTDTESQAAFRLDLEYVMARLARIYAGSQGIVWLESFNYELNGRPIDVLRERGAAEVIAAIDNEEISAL